MLQAIGVVGGVLLLAAVIWLWRGWKAKRRGCPPPLGIVLLLKEPKPINAELLAFHFGQITGRPFKALAPDNIQTPGADDSPAGDFVIGVSPNFLAGADGTIFLINSVSKPYFSEPARLSEDMRELRIKTAIENHRAWLSAEILHPEAVSPENYRIVGRVLAALIGPECVALYHPETNRLIPADLDQAIEQLRSDDPIGGVFGVSPYVPVILIDDDPRLKAAEAEARRRFPEFEAAFRLGRAADFSVKASLASGENSEHIWIQVEEVSEDTVFGSLGNDPVALPDYRLGSKVAVAKTQIEDWAFRHGDEAVGMFTVPVIMELQKERRS